jgi:sarcosine oxidase, subunit gamma
MADLWSRKARDIALRECLPMKIDMLRLRKPSDETLVAVGATLGVTLPTEPNRAAGTRPRAIWMGPGEWMIVEANGDAAAVDAVSGAAATLMVPVGDGRFAIDVSGAGARDFLAKAIAIDLDPMALPVDHTAMTLFAQIPVVIDHATPDRLRLWLDLSFRHYVRAWIEDALVEFA